MRYEIGIAPLLHSSGKRVKGVRRFWHVLGRRLQNRCQGIAKFIVLCSPIGSSLIPRSEKFLPKILLANQCVLIVWQRRANFFLSLLEVRLSWKEAFYLEKIKNFLRLLKSRRKIIFYFIWWACDKKYSTCQKMSEPSYPSGVDASPRPFAAVDKNLTAVLIK